MKQNEHPALDEFTSQGWSPIRNGWPDYLLVRPRDGGLELMCLEVKGDRDRVQPHQLAIHVALKAGGVPVVIRRVKRKHDSTKTP